jgi:hypothetical protein
MIRKSNAESDRLWGRGELKVQLILPGQTRPMGYCDGTEEDEAELVDIAESEGVDDLPIQKRILKTGREIWTMGRPPEPDPDEDWG